MNWEMEIVRMGWACRHMDKPVPHKTIYKGSTMCMPIPRIGEAVQDLTSENLNLKVVGVIYDYKKQGILVQARDEA